MNKDPSPWPNQLRHHSLSTAVIIWPWVSFSSMAPSFVCAPKQQTTTTTRITKQNYSTAHILNYKYTLAFLLVGLFNFDDFLIVFLWEWLIFRGVSNKKAYRSFGRILRPTINLAYDAELSVRWLPGVNSGTRHNRSSNMTSSLLLSLLKVTTVLFLLTLSSFTLEQEQCGVQQLTEHAFYMQNRGLGFIFQNVDTV